MYKHINSVYAGLP